MADEIRVKTNLPAFKKQLEQFDFALQRRIVVRALAAAAQVFKRAIKARAPVLKTKTKGRVAGLLRRSIYIRRRLRGAQRGTVRYVVSFRKTGKDDPFYGKFLEQGWVPRGPGKGLQGGKRRRDAKRLVAAGQKRQYPFIAPAAHEAAAAAMQAFASKLTEELRKAETKQSGGNA